ncbi:universal stress protein [Hoeflea prorocentri]|uniref:Universal stress protein n=1 Tax=Hoeflea prorocentri TaxID=1922333 RepID=A0A9X3ZGS4_9HYPH|nr:universal stress protein [Hoeflea prorocentri]MCY6380534.1 universal stress protein [Hoeflea prorocentri]MDA5398334.1 universal stress protein [Hoeflea prorocentri]
MSYKTILAVLRNKKDCENVLDTALLLTEAFDSHLIGLHAEPAMKVSYAAPIEIPDAAVFKSDQEDVDLRMMDVAEAFKHKSEHRGVSWEWRPIRSLSGDNALSALSSARCADLVVVRQNEEEKEDDFTDLEALVLESGRPVLFVPYVARKASPIKRAIIGWNATRESARAVFDALPLLKSADEVEILCVDPEDNAEQSKSMAGAEVASALTRHGIKVSIKTEISDGLPAAAIIQNRLADTGADLLVMGAYSRSRLREYLFGGVTRTMLQSMPNLTLMSR